MAFTDHADLYGAIHEDGINLVAQHIMRQRPALFNYGTFAFLRNPERPCERIDFTSDVATRGNPLITVEPPIPVLGSGDTLGMDFCAQLVKVAIDFHKGNVISLPPELGASLPPQRLAIAGIVCGGIGCPIGGVLEQVPPSPMPIPPREERQERQPQPPPFVLPWRELTCFCLELAAVAHIESVGSGNARRLLARLDGLEIIDITPDGLESSLECYLSTVLQAVILPRVNIALSTLVLDLMVALPGITFSLPTSAAIPNNPAIEDDQLKVFIDAGI